MGEKSVLYCRGLFCCVFVSASVVQICLAPFSAVGVWKLLILGGKNKSDLEVLSVLLDSVHLMAYSDCYPLKVMALVCSLYKAKLFDPHV